MWHFGFNKIVIGIATAAFVGLILVGGMSRIASFAELVVPFMALLLYYRKFFNSVQKSCSHRTSI